MKVPGPERVSIAADTEGDRMTASFDAAELDARYTHAFELAPFGITMIGARAGDYGTFIHVNAAFCTLIGFPYDQIVGKPFTTFIEPRDAAIVIDATNGLLAGSIDSFRREVRMLRNGSDIIWVRLTRSLMRDAHGAPLYYFTHTEEVTQRRIDQAVLAEANARLRRSLDNAPIGMAVTSIGDDTLGQFLEANPALCRLTGFSREQLLEMSFEDLIHPDGREHSSSAMRELVAGYEAFCTYEERYVRADGTFGWMAVHGSVAYDNSGRPMYCIAQVIDVTKRKAAEGKLEHLAYHDALTGVLNRRGLSQEIKRRSHDALDARSEGALLLLDLDHFKYVNDTMGHGAGDRVLRKVAKLLRATCDAQDIIARLGGDEFVVIVMGAGERQAVELADEIRRVIQSNLYLNSEAALRATASIGIVVLDSLSQSAVDIAMTAADSALSTAKAEGRDRTSVARSRVTSHNEMKIELTWSQRIRSALERDAFALYAQPILNLRTGSVERYELLLRMIDTDGTVIMPDTFLPVAERSGLMAEIDRWVVRSAIALAATLDQTDRRVVFEVNLSGGSLTNESVTACIERELRSTALDPRTLCFEITETAAIGKMDQACSFAEKLTELGCAFALDDFGAGFSSFYYLKYLPFDYLKIDGEFIRNLTTNHADQHIVRAIVALARGLGKETIAEFVGDADTAVMLQAFGVDYAQGYYIGMPLPWGSHGSLTGAGILAAS